jgi:hypothetical protein
MDDSALFMQWAMETLEHEQPAGVVNGDPGEVAFPSLQALRDVSHATLVFDELIMDMEAHAANSGSSGETTDGSGGGNFSSTAPTHHDVSTSFRCAPNHDNNSGPTSTAVMSWNFSAASAQPGGDGTLEDATAVGKPYERAMPDMAHVSQPTRRPSVKSNAGGAGTASAPFVVDHIMAERKRREKINQRFIELSTVIPGLKKVTLQLNPVVSTHRAPRKCGQINLISAVDSDGQGDDPF